jgi:surface polysaccharide O-acyltransferase-like enzyme
VRRSLQQQFSFSSRFLWADVMRIIAIFLVVYVHQLSLLPPLTVVNLWFWVPNFYAYAGVPLFVMISGALLLGKDEPLLIFFRKRVKAVLVPWIIWVGVYIAIDYFIFGLEQQTFLEWLRYAHRMFFSRFWFLPMIFGLYLLTPILRVLIPVVKRNLLIYSLSVWGFAFVFLPAIYRIFGYQLALDSSLLRQVFQYLGLFVLGRVLTQGNLPLLSKKIWSAIFLGSVVVTYISLRLTSATSHRASVDITFSQLFSPTMIIGVISVFMLLYLFLRGRIITNRFLAVMIVELSEAAFGIYLVHELVKEILIRGFPTIASYFRLIDPLFGLPLQTLFVFFLSFAVIFLLRRISFLRFAT